MLRCAVQRSVNTVKRNYEEDGFLHLYDDSRVDTAVDSGSDKVHLIGSDIYSYWYFRQRSKMLFQHILCLLVLY